MLDDVILFLRNDKVSSRDVELAIVQLAEEIRQAKAKLFVLQESQIGLEESLIVAYLWQEKRISQGDTVFVTFADGQAKCIYEGIDKSRWHNECLIKLRHFTKRGGLRKKVTESYNRSIMFGMELFKEGEKK